MKITCAALAAYFIVMATGCQSTRSIGGWLADGLIDSVFDSDKTYSEQISRERQEDGWKSYWRDNPSVNPKMTEAFAEE